MNQLEPDDLPKHDMVHVALLSFFPGRPAPSLFPPPSLLLRKEKENTISGFNEGLQLTTLYKAFELHKGITECREREGPTIDQLVQVYTEKH